MRLRFIPFDLVKAFAKKKNSSDGGSIVVMSSISSIRGYKAKSEYNVSKAAVDAFVRCMSLELASRGIRVNSIMPGEVLTPMALRAKELAAAANVDEYVQPLGPTHPYEVANLIAFLLSDATKTISGTSVRIDGGACVKSVHSWSLPIAQITRVLPRLLLYRNAWASAKSAFALIYHWAALLLLWVFSLLLP